MKKIIFLFISLFIISFAKADTNTSLKDYLENDIGKNTIYNNLGEGHEYNCLSKV